MKITRAAWDHNAQPNKLGLDFQNLSKRIFTIIPVQKKILHPIGAT
jgi:hypothetical protein